MTSSTSDSEPRSRSFPASWTIVASVIWAAGLFGAWEFSIRKDGPRPPGYEGGLHHWTDRYESESRPGTRVIDFLGSSRTIFDVIPAVVAREQPWTVRNLGLHDSSAIPILERRLKETPRGSVLIAEVFPSQFYPDHRSFRVERAEQTLDQLAPYRELESLIHATWRRTLATSHPHASPLQVLRANVRQAVGKEAEDIFDLEGGEVFADGWSASILERLPEEACRQADRWTARWVRELGPRTSPMAYDRLLAKLRHLDRRAEERGIALIFLRPPSSGETARAEEDVFPRRHYWDRLADAFPGRAWHFLDDAKTRDLVARDGSHLTPEDARRYSRALRDRLLQQ